MANIDRGLSLIWLFLWNLNFYSMMVNRYDVVYCFKPAFGIFFSRRLESNSNWLVIRDHCKSGNIIGCTISEPHANRYFRIASYHISGGLRSTIWNWFGKIYINMSNDICFLMKYTLSILMCYYHTCLTPTLDRRNTYIYVTECAKQSCLISGQIWFSHSTVAVAAILNIKLHAVIRTSNSCDGTTESTGNGLDLESHTRHEYSCIFVSSDMYCGARARAVGNAVYYIGRKPSPQPTHSATPPHRPMQMVRGASENSFLHVKSGVFPMAKPHFRSNDSRVCNDWLGCRTKAARCDYCCLLYTIHDIYVTHRCAIVNANMPRSSSHHHHVCMRDGILYCSQNGFAIEFIIFVCHARYASDESHFVPTKLTVFTRLPLFGHASVSHKALENATNFRTAKFVMLTVRVLFMFALH